MKPENLTLGPDFSGVFFAVCSDSLLITVVSLAVTVDCCLVESEGTLFVAKIAPVLQTPVSKQSKTFFKANCLRMCC